MNHSPRLETKSLQRAITVEAAGIEPAQHSRGLRDIDIAWAAGLFEGEGSIYTDRSRQSRGTGRLVVGLGLSSTDLDVLERFRDVLNVGRVQGPYTSAKSTKPYWTWQTRKHAEVRRVVRELAPQLGQRRRETIARLLQEKAETDPLHRDRPRGRRPMSRATAGQLRFG